MSLNSIFCTFIYELSLILIDVDVTCLILFQAFYLIQVYCIFI